MIRSFFTILLITLLSCGSSKQNVTNSKDNKTKAEVISVKISGKEQNYTFSVGIKSPDLGCEQYANWWEVITEKGTLIYRRILGHSHYNEQPFVRSGGKVEINKNKIVIVRVHMNTSGYGISTFKGSVENGFRAFTTDINFANELENIKPQPSGCAF